MPNDSTTAGYLTPVGAAPLDDQALDRFFHDLFVGLTGLDPTLVRPRWQQDPGNFPPRTTSWLAQGITDVKDEGIAWKGYDASGNYVVQRTQVLTNRLSFYGPGASALEGLVRDGLQVEQNRASLQAQGFGLVRVGDPRAMPLLLNEQWVKRIDVPVQFRRTITRTYQVLALESAQVGLASEDGYSTTITINP